MLKAEDPGASAASAYRFLVVQLSGHPELVPSQQAYQKSQRVWIVYLGFHQKTGENTCSNIILWTKWSTVATAPKKWGLCCRYTFLSRHRWCTLTTYWVLHNFTTTTAGDLPPLESTPTSPGIVATFDSGLHVGWIAMCILWRSGFGSWADFCLLVDLPRLPWLTTGWLIPTQKNKSSEIIGCRSFIKIVIYTSWHMAWEK